MPHKRNPVRSVLILAAGALRARGLLATLAAASEHELERVAGAWHAERQPLADLLRPTGSAASWSGPLLTGLRGPCRPDARQSGQDQRAPTG